MKKYIIAFSLILLSLDNMLAQGPTLNLVGSGLTFNKGNINTEVLSAIVEQKQKEVYQKVFRNTVIEGFNDVSMLKNFRNFATYHYLYKLMETMTTVKNKEMATSSIIELSSEYATVYGLLIYITRIENKIKFGDLTIDSRLFERAIRKIDGKGKEGKITDATDIKTFNLVIDICYDIVLRNNDFRKKFKLKEDLSDKKFLTFYQSENIFYLISKTFERAIEQPEKINMDTLVAFKLIDKEYFEKIPKNAEKIAYLKARYDILLTFRDSVLKEFKILLDKATKIKTAVSSLQDVYNGLKNENSKNDIQKVLNNFGQLTKEQLEEKSVVFNKVDDPATGKMLKKNFEDIFNGIGKNYNDYKEIIYFFQDLEKTDFKKFVLTKDQFYSMKYILNKFLELAKNQFDDHVAAKVIEFMLENAIVQYRESKTNNPVNEEDASLNSTGYLYIDIESLISAIDLHYDSKTRKSSVSAWYWFVNFRPFLSIGTNYAYFLNTNSLGRTEDGNFSSLRNLYFASEKIGLKLKLYDKNYTRSFQPGEKFQLYGKDRIWLRPQKTATLTNIHLMVYGSGILYNLANLKSEDKFNYAILGASIGFTFFNGLSFNLGFASPITNSTFGGSNNYVNIGFDIPIIDYISALTKKN